MSDGLVVRELVVRYGKATALAGIDLEVEPGTATAILGRNGAGKSSLLGAIAGSTPAAEGTIRWNGLDVTRTPADRRSRRGIHLVPEGRRIFPKLEVVENLMLGGFNLGKDELAERIDRTAQLFPVLGERLSWPAGRLSGGQQQMLAIGRALMSQPDLLLLDEPSLGLAPQAIDAVYDQLEALRETRITMLLVEQQVHRALRLVDEAVVLSLGEVVVRDDPERLADDPRLMAAYLGGEAR